MSEKKELKFPRFTDKLGENTRLALYLSVLYLAANAAWYSESVQADLSKYWQIYEVFGEFAANFVLGKLGDIAVPTAAWAIGGAVFQIDRLIFNRTDGRETIDDICATITSLSAFLIYTTTELLTFTTYIDTSKCGEPLEMCPGELSDIALFALPVLLSLAALNRKKIVRILQITEQES